jgi:HSP20 family protein
MTFKPHNTMTLVKHRPQGSLVSPFDGFFNGFFGRDITQLMGSDELFRNAPRVNISESKEGFNLDMLAPGFSKESIHMNVENDTLTMSGEVSTDTENKDDATGTRYTRREFSYGSFKRSFKLPENVKAEDIKAEYVNGVLKVFIPKAEPVKPASTTIKIS